MSTALGPAVILSTGNENLAVVVYTGNAATPDAATTAVLRQRALNLPQPMRVFMISKFLYNPAQVEKLLKVTNYPTTAMKALPEALSGIEDKSSQHNLVNGAKAVDPKEYMFAVNYTFEEIHGSTFIKRQLATPEQIKIYRMMEVRLPLDTVTWSCEDDSTKAKNQTVVDVITRTAAGVAGTATTSLTASNGKFKFPPKEHTGIMIVVMHCLPYRYYLPQVYEFFTHGVIYSRATLESHKLPAPVCEIIMASINFFAEQLPRYCSEIRLLGRYDTLTVTESFELAVKVPMSLRLFFLAYYRSVAVAFGDVDPRLWDDMSVEEVAGMFAETNTLVLEFIQHIAFLRAGSDAGWTDHGAVERQQISVNRWSGFTVPSTKGKAILVEAVRLATEKSKAMALKARGMNEKSVDGAGVDKKKKKNGTTNKDKGPKCHKCKKFGHVRRDCPVIEATKAAADANKEAGKRRERE